MFFVWRIALKQVQWKRRDRLTVEFMVLEGQIALAHERIREQIEHMRQGQQYVHYYFVPAWDAHTGYP